VAQNPYSLLENVEKVTCHHSIVRASIEVKPTVDVIEGEIRMKNGYFKTVIKY
jgi:hypothetical protein